MNRSPRRTSARPSKPKRDPAGTPGRSQKIGLKIGEAAELVGVKPFVLRFWETQFSFLRPSHARYKHRVYGSDDVANLKLVKRLLHEERFTIEGARKHLRELGLERVRTELKGASARLTRPPAGIFTPGQDALRQTLGEIRRELASLYRLLD